MGVPYGHPQRTARSPIPIADNCPVETRSLMSEIDPARVTFIKIDAERNEAAVLGGMV